MSDLSRLKEVSALPRARVVLCLNSELHAELAELERALAAEVSGDDQEPDQALSERSRVSELTSRVDAVKDRVAASTVTFEFTALPRSRFAELEEAHKPAEDGLHSFEFLCALIAASLTSHTLSPAEAKEWLQDSLSQGQADSLVATAWSVNHETGETKLPFSVSGSAMTR